MKKHVYYLDKMVPVLMTAGFTVHVINVARYLQDGTVALSQILLPLVDFALTIPMVYCAVVMIFFYKKVFRTYDLSATWRKVAYWFIAFYITTSIPGHIKFQLSGDTTYFDSFAWWFSPIIMVVYVLFMMFFFTLKTRED